jgi:hypothetical protein
VEIGLGDVGLQAAGLRHCVTELGINFLFIFGNFPWGSFLVRASGKSV